MSCKDDVIVTGTESEPSSNSALVFCLHIDKKAIHILSYYYIFEQMYRLNFLPLTIC